MSKKKRRTHSKKKEQKRTPVTIFATAYVSLMMEVASKDDLSGYEIIANLQKQVKLFNSAKPERLMDPEVSIWLYQSLCDSMTSCPIGLLMIAFPLDDKEVIQMRLENLTLEELETLTMDYNTLRRHPNPDIQCFFSGFEEALEIGRQIVGTPPTTDFNLQERCNYLFMNTPLDEIERLKGPRQLAP